MNWLTPSVVRLAISSNGSLKKIASQPVRHLLLLVLVLNPARLHLLNKKPRGSKLRLKSLGGNLMNDLRQVLNGRGQGRDVGGDLFVVGQTDLSCVLQPGDDAESPGRETASAMTRGAVQ